MVARKNFRNQEHRVRTRDAGFEHLISIENKLFTQHRQMDDALDCR